MNVFLKKFLILLLRLAKGSSIVGHLLRLTFLPGVKR
jgi:hypothetical protein